MGALSGDSNINDAAYFAIFLQPASGVTYSYTGATESSPKPGGAGDDWQATLTAANPFGTGTGTWVEFAKLSASAVTVVANNTSWNDTVNGPNGKTYHDNGAAPIYWGSTAGMIDSRTFPNPFSFTLTGMNVTPGSSVTFNGYASEVVFCTPYTVTKVPFTLTLTAQSGVPEPDSMVLLGLGAASLLAGVVRKKKKTADQQ